MMCDLSVRFSARHASGSEAATASVKACGLETLTLAHGCQMLSIGRLVAATNTVAMPLQDQPLSRNSFQKCSNLRLLA
jgi:hypothetical protein